MTELAQKIHDLRNQNKTYDEICFILKCSKGTVSYHLGEGQKDKTLNRTRKGRGKQHPYIRKIESFRQDRYNYRSRRQVSNATIQKKLKAKLEGFHNPTRRKTKMYNKPTFTIEDVFTKLGQSPKCYLTGQEIDITNPSTYAFDHVIPVSRGGTNTLDNLGICIRQVNMSKTDMTPDEYINLCKLVLEHNGYSIVKT